MNSDDTTIKFLERTREMYAQRIGAGAGSAFPSFDSATSTFRTQCFDEDAKEYYEAISDSLMRAYKERREFRID